MPEAVIVATARSPIGRAGKGSLRDIRPDDLAAPWSTRRSRRFPSSILPDIDDLIIGCAQPAGEQGYNIARVVSVLAGMDPPGTQRSTGTAPRACRAPAWPSTRSRPEKATSSSPQAWSQSAATPTASPTACPTRRTSSSPRRWSGPISQTARRSWSDPRAEGDVPNIYIAMGHTAENVADLRGVSRTAQDEFALRSQNLAEEAIAKGFWEREITPVTAARRNSRLDRRRPTRRGDARGPERPVASVPRQRHGHCRQLLCV